MLIILHSIAYQARSSQLRQAVLLIRHLSAYDLASLVDVLMGQTLSSAIMVHSCNFSARRLKEEGCYGAEASLSYKARLSQKGKINYFYQQFKSHSEVMPNSNQSIRIWLIIKCQSSLRCLCICQNKPRTSHRKMYF